MKSVRLGCRLSLHPLVAALHSPSLHPPAASTVANRFSLSLSLLLLPFFLSLRLSPSPDSFRLLRSLGPIVQLFALSLSLSFSLPLLLFPQRSLSSAPVRRGAGAKRTKPKLKLSAVASSVVSSCAAGSACWYCCWCRCFCCFYSPSFYLYPSARASSSSSSSTLSFLPFSFSRFSLSLSVSLSFLVRPQHRGQKSLVAYLRERGRERERVSLCTGLVRVEDTVRNWLAEMARHSFRHRNQPARLLFHTATHPLRDHRSFSPYLPTPLLLRSRRISDEGMSP